MVLGAHASHAVYGEEIPTTSAPQEDERAAGEGESPAEEEE